ncbi:MAG: aminopeptidase [Eubacteriales bacterium]|nr:aminopeptidase [Eubacteriales bacterium]
MYKEKLKKYAEAIVRVGINAQEGDNVVVNTDTDSLELAREVVRACWRAGAADVDTIISDNDIALGRFEEARDDVFYSVPPFKVEYSERHMQNKYHRISVSAPRLDLFQNVDPDRLRRSSIASSTAFEPIMKYMDTGEIKWVVAAGASELWAKALFPDLEVAEAMDQLWEKIFTACRISDTGDAVEAWIRHDARLKAYEKWLDTQQFDYLHYEAPGTDFKVGLADQHKWIGGSSLTPDGIRYMANMPTEEIFTTPHSEKAQGKLKSTMPLAISGKVVEDFGFVFEDGKLVDFFAGKNGDVLETQLDMDEGAKRLGEIALVPNSSPISQMGITFKSTLFDENASCHFAFGKAYAEALIGGENMSKEERAELGFNSSMIHLDFMVGGPELNVTGYRKDGSSVQVMKNGEWAVNPE